MESTFVTRSARLALAATLLFGLVGPAPSVGAQDAADPVTIPPPKGPDPGEAPESETGLGAERSPDAEPPREVVIYKPPPRGSPNGLRPGGTRGATALPQPLALAPDHVARTIRAAPSLFWHLNGIPPEHAVLVFTLIEVDGLAPLREVRLPHPDAPGIQRVRLDALGVTLPIGTNYKWTVSLEAGPQPSLQDALAEGYLRRVRVPPLLGEDRSAASYAAMGLWYDALEVLSDDIDAGAGPVPEAQRRSLLRQAGLEGALD